MKLPDNAVLLDVRQTDEFNAGHIDGAVLVPHDTIAEKIGALCRIRIFPYMCIAAPAGVPR